MADAGALEGSAVLVATSFTGLLGLGVGAFFAFFGAGADASGALRLRSPTISARGKRSRIYCISSGRTYANRRRCNGKSCDLDVESREA